MAPHSDGLLAEKGHGHSSFFASSKAWVLRHKLLAGAIMFSLLTLVVVLPSVLTTCCHARPVTHSDCNSLLTNNTANFPGLLQTWWHSTGEVNWRTPVQDGNVRQSHMYEISVSLDGLNFFDSFVYETIPRNGNGNILQPGNLSSTTDAVDSITIEQDLNMTMAWSSFYYGADVTLKVHRLNGATTNTSNVIIRPSTLDYVVSPAGDDVTIRVPHSSVGSRFSIEFRDNLYEYRLDQTAPIADFVQNQDPEGYGYVSEYTDDMPIIGVEPHDSLMIFASPFPSKDLIPSSRNAYHVPPGLVSNLSSVTASTVIFGPGVYWTTGTAIANLSTSTNWIHFAPGSYVKSAIWFNSPSSTLRATGPGVLSGEQYVYQANMASGFSNNKSDETSVRMWAGTITNATQFILHGPTVNAPPFNSMDFRGNVENLSVHASDYKQVGAFFGQTDGLQAYPGSTLSNIFYHSNDDTIKTYYSNVSVKDIVVWKGRTAPTIQFGWASRNLSNVLVDNIDIIHSRYNQNNTHPAIIGANQVYTASETNTSTASTSNTVENITFTNIRSEGISPSLFRIVPLSNFKNFTIANVSIEQTLPQSTDMCTSYLPAWTNSQGESVEIQGFSVTNYTVGQTGVSYARNNWQTGRQGNMWIAQVWGRDGNSVDINL